MAQQSVVVIGATTTLRPLASVLVAGGAEVLAIARDMSNPPEGCATAAVDARDAAALDRALGGRRWNVVVAYEPAVSPASLEVIERCSDRHVLVRPSAAADPAHSTDDFVAANDELVLGWRDGASRWHGPHEISAAALLVLDDGHGRVLGHVRPWADRP